MTVKVPFHVVVDSKSPNGIRWARSAQHRCGIDGKLSHLRIANSIVIISHNDISQFQTIKENGTWSWGRETQR